MSRLRYLIFISSYIHFLSGSDPWVDSTRKLRGGKYYALACFSEKCGCVLFMCHHRQDLLIWFPALKTCSRGEILYGLTCLDWDPVNTKKSKKFSMGEACLVFDIGKSQQYIISNLTNETSEIYQNKINKLNFSSIIWL